jgi:hypothetical protein
VADGGGAGGFVDEGHGFGGGDEFRPGRAGLKGRERGAKKSCHGQNT